MLPMVPENSVLENGGTLITQPPKYKRRRVSAVRDFPPGCGPNAPRTDTNGNAANYCSENVKDTEQSAHNHPDIDSQKEKSEHAVGDSSQTHASLDGVDKVGCVLNGGKILIKDGSSDEGLLDLSDHMPLEMRMRSCSSSETLQGNTEDGSKESLKEAQELSRDLTEVGQETPTGVVKSMEEIESKEISVDNIATAQELSRDLTEVEQETPTGVSNSMKEMESKEIAIDNIVATEKIAAEAKSCPHYPIPSTVVWKERTYPPRMRVSAVRNFPAGCGTNVPLNSNSFPVDASDHRQTTEEKMGSESGNVDVGADIKERRDHIHGDVVVGDGTAEFACGTKDEAQVEADKDDLGETSVKSAEVQPPASPEKANEANEGESHEQLEVVHDKMIESGVSKGKERKKFIVYRKDKGERKRATVFRGSDTALQAGSAVDSHQKEGLVVVLALMTASNSQWKNIRGADKAALSSAAANAKKQKDCSVESNKRQKLESVVNEAMEDAEQRLEKERLNKSTSSTTTAKYKRYKKCAVGKPQKFKSVVNEAIVDAEQSEEEDRMNESGSSAQDPGVAQGEMAIWDERNSSENVQQQNRSRGFNVSVIPFGASTSSDRGARNKVRETLRLFQVVLRKLLQEHETKPKEERNAKSRIDLQASKILKSKGKYINTGTQIVGVVPGVEVGDEFHYRVELMMIGLHRQSQAGIDCTKLDGKVIATSIVASGGYENDVENSDTLIFSGQGGNSAGADKKPEDQKLERGNLGLKNSIDEKNFVRVIRGVKETKPSDIEGKPAKVITTYTYDGLYTVERYWQEIGQHGKKVYKFELKRIPDQPELVWKERNKSNRSKVREGRCVDDIAEGKESFHIAAFNNVDDEKPPPFKYVTKTMYPDWCKPLPLQGCNCRNGCSDSSRCPCVVKNRGEIPFNFDGAIVEAKSLVFECGPSCRCPSSCHNRVSQHGIKFPLEIFKTKHRGWGVRCSSSIPSGSFICEYIGELLEDKEAEKRTGNDEYLFDIGQDYIDHDHSLWKGLSGLLPDASSSSTEVVDVGFTIDAAQYGNVGRFINHSCSPNLYAQNVLYDHDDRRIPHIMFFAAENIPPLQELTYHYNYTVGTVYDRDGNVKVKNCYCGSSDCSGRMY